MADLNDNVEQITHYYPFGMAFAESQGSELQPYKYNNKELDKELGLEIYDYVARQRGNDIPVFTSIDPLAEKYYSWSPYAYVMNNPLKYIDPDGKQTSFPIGNFLGINWKQAAVQQKAEKLASDAATPSGVGVTLSAGVSGGVAVGGSLSAVYFTKGLDKGTVSTYRKGNAGVGLHGGSITLGVDLIYSDSPSTLTAQSLEGKSTDYSVSAGKGSYTSGITHSESKTESGDNITTKSVNVGRGVGSFPIGIERTTGVTTQISGSTKSEAKDAKEVNARVKQVEERQINSLWDWLIK